MELSEIIVQTVLVHYPAVQGIYLFGSFAAQQEHLGSDVDIALLLPHAMASEEQVLSLSECRSELEDALERDVHLVNVRMVSTVFQFQIVMTGRLILKADKRAVDEFEMLVMSLYQKLNEERREIMEEFEKTGRAYAV